MLPTRVMGVWIRALLLMLLTVGVVVACQPRDLLRLGDGLAPRPLPTEAPSPTPRSPAIAPVPAAEPTPTPIPQVVGDRLWQDLEALSFERFSVADRDRAQAYITQQLQAAGWTVTPQPFDDGAGVNLLAERPGAAPTADTLLLGAHYDTVADSPGSDDNATGLAVLLEAARLLGDRPTVRGLKLAFFDLEEAGLRGSLAMAAEDGLIADLAGAVVLDMVGYACREPDCQTYPENLPIQPPSNTGDFVAVVGDIEHPGLLTAFQEARQSDSPGVFTLPVPFKGLLTPDTMRSDHAPFWYRGLGAVLVTDTANLRNPHYHTRSDRPETLDRDFFIGTAQIVVNAVTSILDSAEPLGVPGPALPPSG
ncbi:M28 family peptidase [Geitlerinema sp. PCC 7407]|uniref:M28 family peptidase n=1 Tax=Geitlerinema sp. PCC 7407 TaxID=1173025 RepID=UPI00029FA01D|nr:M28 family peptidase [Geitlerinema sp. PCC 7407]AFY67096.1 peptidase M28 [Geitlerinema sp. PCC 7407]